MSIESRTEQYQCKTLNGAATVTINSIGHTSSRSGQTDAVIEKMEGCDSCRACGVAENGSYDANWSKCEHPKSAS